ncbi:hypothetical protein [Streptosporangium sp. NPDC000509]
MKTARLAPARHLDSPPTSGDITGWGFRELGLDDEIHQLIR